MMKKDIYEILNSLSIAYKKYDHPPRHSTEDIGSFADEVDGMIMKNLFMRDKRGRQHYLVVVPYHKTVDLSALAELLDQKKVGFASPERLLKYLSLTPGSVTMMGLVHDEDNHVEVLIDEELLAHEKVCCHPLINTATIEITREDMQKFLDSTGNVVRYIKIS